MSDPTIEQALETAIGAVLSRVNTAMPAEIRQYDYQTKTATVQPLIRLRSTDGTFISRATISGVPVIMPSTFGGQAALDLPVLRGDQCLIVCSQRSIDNWMRTGREADPATADRFSMSDAIAIVGLQSGGRGQAGTKDSVRLRFQGSVIELRKDGSVSVKGTRIAIGTQGNELLSLLGSLIDLFALHVQAMTTATYPPPTGNLDPAAATLLASQVAQARALLSQLKALTGTI